MIASTSFPRVNKNCVTCGDKVRDSYYVLSDQSYIHQPCLEVIKYSSLDNGLDEHVRQFYNFLLSKVVNCFKCNNPLDRVHKDYLTSPHCVACRPFNIFEPKQETQFCELCDQQITQLNKLKKEPLIQGIIMCGICFKMQTGQQDIQLQQKPDLREIKPKLLQKKQIKPNSSFQEIVHFKPTFNIKAKQLKIQQIQKPKILPQLQSLITCLICYKQTDKSDFQEISDSLGVCKDCSTLKDLFYLNKEQIKIDIDDEKQQESYGLQGLFFQKDQENDLPKLIKVTPVVQKNRKIEQIKNTKRQKDNWLVQQTRKIKEEKHNYLLKECKICFNAQSQMINTQCRHLMMCQTCYKAMLKRQNKKHQLSCPVCQTVGKYYKYLQPIYI